MLRKTLVELPRWQKRVICQVVDVACLCTALLLAYALRVGSSGLLSDYSGQFIQLCALAILITVPVYVQFGLYHAVVRYTGQHMIFSVVQTTALAGLFLSATVFLLQIEGVPRSVIPLYCFFSLFLVCGSRYTARYWLSGYGFTEIVLSPFKQYQPGGYVRQGIPVAVYGVGTAGTQLVDALDKGRRYKRSLLSTMTRACMAVRSVAEKCFTLIIWTPCCSSLNWRKFFSPFLLRAKQEDLR